MRFRCLFIVSLFLFSVGTSAETFTVNTNSDENNPSDALVTLREAIALANSSGESDTINFDVSLAGHTITTSGYTIANGLTIDGSNAEGLVIRPEGGGTIFTVDAAVAFDVSNLQLMGGSSSGSGFAVRNCGNLNVSNVSFSRFDTSLSSHCSVPFQATLDKVAFKNNSRSISTSQAFNVVGTSSVTVSSSYFEGSPIVVESRGEKVLLDITSSFLTKKSNLYLYGAVEMIFKDSSYTDNPGAMLLARYSRAREEAYAPYLYYIPEVVIASSTITGNGRTDQNYYLLDLQGAEVTIKNSTIHGNSFGEGRIGNRLIYSSAIYDDGRESLYGSLTVSNSIISDNGSDASALYFGSGDLEVNYSVVPLIVNFGGENTTISLDSTTQLYQGASVEMGELTFSELYPPYLMPESSSFVIGAGDPSSVSGEAGVPLTDQRGSERVLDGAIDLGAIEYNNPPELDVAALREAFREQVAALIAAETPDEDIVLDLDTFAIDADLDAVVDIELLNLEGYTYDSDTHIVSASRGVFESLAIRVDLEDEHGLKNRQELYVKPPVAVAESSGSSGGALSFLGLAAVTLLSLRRRRSAQRIALNSM